MANGDAHLTTLISVLDIYNVLRYIRTLSLRYINIYLIFQDSTEVVNMKLSLTIKPTFNVILHI